jgi:two-component system chemotaxis response regulator CheY
MADECHVPSGRKMGASVFIVDDEEAIVEVYQTILENEDIKVIDTACNGKEALEKFKGLKDRPDVVLMDQIMPSLDGISTMVEMHKIDPSLKVLFISADLASKTQAIRSGAIAFIEKPFRLTEFITAVRRAIEMSPDALTGDDQPNRMFLPRTR